MAQTNYTLLVEIDLGAVVTNALALTVRLPAAVLGVAYSGQLTASNGTAPYTYAISAGSLPSGLSLNTATGAITGTPSASGYVELTASVTDSTLPSNQTAAKVVSITVGSGVAVAGGLAQAEVGIAYSSGLSASGGTAPYVWTIASGSLPGGLSINSSTGVISGTPTTAGGFNFTVRATDAASEPKDFPTSITVADPVSLTGTYPAGTVGIAYANSLVTSDGVSPFAYARTSGALPPGLTLSPTTGALTGTPTAAATYTFDVTVTDLLGGADTSSQSVVMSAAGGGSTSPLTTKGDIYTHNATVDTRLPVGADGTYLVADSTTATGLKYATVAASHKYPSAYFTSPGQATALIGSIKCVTPPLAYAGTIIAWDFIGDGNTGSATCTVKKCAAAGYPGSLATILTPAIASAKKASATGLSIAVSVGDVIEFTGSGFLTFMYANFTMDIQL